MGSCFNSRANGYLLGNGLCSRNNRTILRKEDLKLGESPASFLSCNRTIVRIQRLAGRCVPAVKKNKKRY